MPDVYERFLERYKKYTEIQSLAISQVAEGRNCLIIAPTGSGKTEAAVLPLLDRLSKEQDRRGVRVLYITPLRALNRDMVRRLEELCSGIGVSIAVRHGDTEQKERNRQQRMAPQVLVTTPESLQSMLPTKGMGPALRNVMAVVVDEIHELYSNKRGAQLSVALERLAELAPGFQRIGISATVGDPSAVGAFMCNGADCKLIAASRQRGMDIKIEMPRSTAQPDADLAAKFDLDANSSARLHAIVDGVQGSSSAIIFANTRQVVEALGSRLLYLESVRPFGGIGVHHSSLDRLSRIEIENSFKAGRIKSIIATSSLELGIDVGAVDLVVQYGSPRQALRLVQRVGRSGHSIGRTPRGLIVTASVIDTVESMAIACNARMGVLERSCARKGALDVLANQICGIVLDTGGCSVEHMVAILRRSSSYADIGIEVLANLLDFMQAHKLIRFDGSTASASSRTRMYYYGHLSVIPDSKRFAVKSMADNRIISSLDEAFVSSYVEEGSVFITKGLPWKVVSIDEGMITVEPSSDLEAAVPDWSGEDIPVSASVASAVLSMADGRARLGVQGAQVDGATLEEVEDFVARQRRFHEGVDGELLVERGQEHTILHTGLGTLANDALSRMLSWKFTEAYGRSVNIKSSPYLVLLELGRDIDVEELVRKIAVDGWRYVLEDALPTTELFRRRFITIAKLFGIIEKEATVTKSIAKRLLRVYYGTPPYKEAMRELVEDYFDADTLEQFLSGIRSGRTKLRVISADALSPLAKEVLNSAYYTRELVMPLLPSDSVVSSFEGFMLRKEIKLMCTYCGFTFTRKLSELRAQDSIRCESCGSPMIARYSDENAGLVRERAGGKRLRKASHAGLEAMMKEASLFASYGGKAAIALSTYGVGPSAAARVLRMFRREDRLFYMDLLDEQKTFIKNRKYWSI